MSRGGRQRGADRLRPAAAFGLGALLLLAAAHSARRATLARADFAFCNQTDVTSLDPAAASGEPSSRILRALFEGLTRLDPATLAPLPGMAESWEVSPDGLLWSFHVRQEARWSNGDPLTAHDLRDNLLRALAPDTAARNAYFLWCVEGAADYTAGRDPAAAAVGISAPSPHELLLRLVQPTPYLASLLADPTFLPVHLASRERAGAEWLRPENLVTNGPFRLASRRLRDRIRLERFAGYWDAPAVRLQTIDALAASAITTQLNLYLQGEVDWMIKPPPALVDELQEREDFLVGPQFGSTFLRFNVWGGPFAAPAGPSPFADVRVRTALTLALDRRSLAEDVMRGGHRSLDSFVPAGLSGYAPAPLAPADPERARSLLAEAGYPGGKGFPPFSLLYPHNESTRDFCEALAAQWRHTLGLQPRLVNQVFGVYLDSTRHGLYDTAWSAWIGDYLDPSSFLEIFLTGSGNNRTGWSHSEYDALVLAARREVDGPPRARLLRQAEEILLAELPLAPVYQRVNMHLLSPRVRGFHDNLLDIHPLRDLWVEAPPP